MCRFQYSRTSAVAGTTDGDTPHYYRIKATPCGRATSHGSTPMNSTCSSSAAASMGLPSRYDAASRGLRVALVEAGDFGSGASFNHQKTAHGGLRSLQSGHLRLAREGIRERRALARIAPWLLRPLPFLVGTYRSVVKNRLALRAAFRFDAWLGRHRNDGVEPELHLPAPRLVSKAATLQLFAGHQARRTDRRRAVVRLPDGRERPADDRVCGSRRSYRRRAGELRRVPSQP